MSVPAFKSLSIRQIRTLIKSELNKPPTPSQEARWVAANQDKFIQCLACREAQIRCIPNSTRLHCSNSVCRNSKDHPRCSRLDEELFDRVKDAEKGVISQEQFEEAASLVLQHTVEIYRPTTSNERTARTSESISGVGNQAYEGMNDHNIQLTKENQRNIASLAALRMQNEVLRTQHAELQAGIDAKNQKLQDENDELKKRIKELSTVTTSTNKNDQQLRNVAEHFELEQQHLVLSHALDSPDLHIKVKEHMNVLKEMAARRLTIPITYDEIMDISTSRKRTAEEDNSDEKSSRAQKRVRENST
ncbi:hypothetical protein BDZ89DRAFT_1065437 [Hymenopellis radicata]|nr:hypothetical protein BDZ89DRAFT_1065437 [Hymenopellis radicata]